MSNIEDRGKSEHFPSIFLKQMMCIGSLGDVGETCFGKSSSFYNQLHFSALNEEEEGPRLPLPECSYRVGYFVYQSGF